MGEEGWRVGKDSPIEDRGYIEIGSDPRREAVVRYLEKHPVENFIRFNAYLAGRVVRNTLENLYGYLADLFKPRT